MRIDYLCDHAHHIPTIATWQQAQWSRVSPSETIEKRKASLKNHLKTNGLPITYIALENIGSGLLGSVSLVQHDLPGRLEFAPWLSRLYVANTQRCRGIGSALVKRGVEHVAQLGYSKIYVFTLEHEEFFEKLGWYKVGQVMLYGKKDTILAFDIDT